MVKYLTLGRIKYPRLTYLGIGLGIGLIVAIATGIISNSYVSKIETEFKLRQEEYITERQVHTAKITSLTETNKQLKSRTVKVKLIKPDGTIEEREEIDLDSNTSIISNIQMEYKLRIENETLKIREEYSRKLVESE